MSGSVSSVTMSTRLSPRFNRGVRGSGALLFSLYSLLRHLLTEVRDVGSHRFGPLPKTEVEKRLQHVIDAEKYAHPALLPAPPQDPDRTPL